ncbi:MAG: amylo-alpha-1,6-glucosidase [Cyanobacteria bacterium]|nr:amylo-alpha-1,6-glucosidase [Cyanobacteriota bacterium]MDW8201547.1 amylo-alpha-1,6-glucosidase [Cyanobacteriota bacterium SKYGB_h_bin112]
MTIQFGRDICGDLEAAESREWLVTNGIGGYACGTIAGHLTRHYHGLLIAALNPPLGRTLLLAKLEETATYHQHPYLLSTNRWSDGSIHPQGFRWIERFSLEGTVPTWQFALADALVIKRVWMQRGENTTYITYTLHRGSAALDLTIKALVNYRDHHGGSTYGDWQVDTLAQGICVKAFAEATPFYLFTSQGTVTSAQTWYHNVDLAGERSRGTGDHESHLHAATITLTLMLGDTLTIVASTNSSPRLNGQAALADQHQYDQGLLERWTSAAPHHAQSPGWIQQLVLAADQFVVDRPIASEPQGKTVIAGYPWFGDWGRDTMISLPGLTITTGRPELARPILRTFGRYLDQGMLPNLFPESGQVPSYNTVDATLWYFEAIRAYYQATHDQSLLVELFPALAESIDWHRRGTRYRIQVDPADGLLYAGEPGVQLTWMDAKVGTWVVTPRIGKPIEISALWYNALISMVQFAQVIGRPYQDYQRWAEQCVRGFQRFWNPDQGCCFDVLDTPGGNDDAIRPNQIFAVSLPTDPNLSPTPLLMPSCQKAVVDTVARELLTSYGLRSLAPYDPHYIGFYRGDQFQRDSAYHQGTVWGWLLGAFVQAHLRVYQQPDSARELLEPIADHLRAAGLGSISEIFEGEPPHQARGCIAQAWSVAETLRAWDWVTRSS